MSIEIERSLESVRNKIIQHPVYATIRRLDELRIFMKFHVYAVWDFMSLLKALQLELTCTSIPWFPVGSGKMRLLINHIVAGEESDIDIDGHQLSHFEMYLQAMTQCGADTSEITTFIKTLQQTGDFEQAFEAAGTPISARNFVNNTFSVIRTKQPHLIASAFTYGREDLIPAMFTAMVDELQKQFPDQLDSYKYYLDRHIEVDGDEHGHMAITMTNELCNNDSEKIKAAIQIAVESLQHRLMLWDEALLEIKKNLPGFNNCS